jgi:hypothetical protein
MMAICVRVLASKMTEKNDRGYSKGCQRSPIEGERDSEPHAHCKLVIFQGH